MSTEETGAAAVASETPVEGATVEVPRQKPRRLISLQYNYSDSDEEETREERKARIVSEDLVQTQMSDIAGFLDSASEALRNLTISVLQRCCAVNTETGIPSDFEIKSTVSLQIKIAAALLHFGT